VATLAVPSRENTAPKTLPQTARKMALDRTGADLTLDNFILGMESVKGYQDIFNGPKLSFGRDKHQGANSSFLAVVKGGRWVRVTDPLTY
jgi:hypothetical protein